MSCFGYGRQHSLCSLAQVLVLVLAQVSVLA